jgi:hypothetical protein
LLLHARVKRTLRLVALALLAVRCDGVSNRDFDCELAVGHLADCCQGFPFKDMYCETTVGCDSHTVPNLRLDESQCILGLDCDEINRRNLCEKVVRLGRAIQWQCSYPDLGYVAPIGWGLGGTDCKEVDVSEQRQPVCQ